MRHYINKLVHNKLFLFVFKTFRFHKHKYYLHKDPKITANLDYKKIFKKNINWENPENLIEKISWMQLNSDTSKWALCADKYKMRLFVKEKGLEILLPKLYAHTVDPANFDFSLLPNEFVIKSNNACGTVMIVKDKSKLKIHKVKRVLKKWLKYKFGVLGAQLHYLKIPPEIIFEELLKDQSRPNEPLIDYKFSCFNGVPESVLVVSNRNTKISNHYDLNLYDLEWNDISHNLCEHNGKCNIPKPLSIDSMIKACKILGSEFPYVRIDFYEVNGKPYLGEMTFTSGYGYFTNEYYNYLGEKIAI